ncbi:hypothetical protein GCM10011583_18090 [Streptomyces camponoticapitis]|uniref:Uncharacterized protein n=1 Tax=Streptomyces camponoticapitis TaxID=1616125 RepID=A0ABQ2E1A9_9ACTN|nr:hypothetical protein [Streptomyces camponoticapitis]GGJ86888.1 hypothetical protein GCM10011583_18090 [Streptomyces camponoticapitis]
MFGSKKTDEEKAAAKRNRQIVAAAAAAGVTAYGGNFKSPSQMDVPIEGARVTIEKGEQAKARITATRVALTGIFALWLKKDMNQLFITIEGAGGEVLVQPVAARKEAQARVFATMVNGEATGISKID